jgi:hypothetical protein
MKTEDVIPTFCPTCGKLVWKGWCRWGLPVTADIKRLSVIDQVKAKLNGRQIYRVIKTSVSIRLKAHDKWSIEYYKDPVVIASHTCSTTHLFQTMDDVPDYFPKPQPSPTPASSHPVPEGFPF